MKLKVNQDACIGCGACQAIAEELFEINDEGLSEVKAEANTDELKEKATEAIDSCPTGAIEEDNDEEKK